MDEFKELHYLRPHGDQWGNKQHIIPMVGSKVEDPEPNAWELYLKAVKEAENIKKT